MPALDDLPQHDPTASEPSSGSDDSSWSAYGGDDGVPARLGGVRIVRQLGEGGMGRVYLGHHPLLDIDVAVKVLLDRHDDGDRFLTEARLAARIDHPNIVRILHAGNERGIRFLVMQYVPGCTLRQLVQERGPLPWRDAAAYLLQAAQGLAAAHRQGIIHRDVKPSNMLVDGAGVLRVSDLGVARAVFGSSEATATGHIVGTPAYMAPEQARGPQSVTPAADVYGLGASFYYLVTGKTPYQGLTFPDLLQAHRESPVPDPRRLARDLPAGVAECCRRLMAREAWNRPADGAAAALELERLLGLATVSTARPPSAAPPAPASRRRWLVAGACCLAGAGILLLGSTLPPSRPTPPRAAVAPPAPVPVPAPPAAVAPPADAWQTPPRAVFVLAERVPALALAGIDAACSGSGLPVVERQRIDALVREQEMLANGRVDPASAGRIARLVGGHIAVFANAAEDRVEIRTVLVETGEVASSRFVPPAEAGAAVSAGIAAAVALLPAQGRVALAGGSASVSLGARHGIRAGDRLELRRAADGATFATATVIAVERDRASFDLQPADAECAGALALRSAQ